MLRGNDKLPADGKKDTKIAKKAEDDRETMKEAADKVDTAVDDSFPASDPPSFNPGTTSTKDKPKASEAKKQIETKH